MVLTVGVILLMVFVFIMAVLRAVYYMFMLKVDPIHSIAGVPHIKNWFQKHEDEVRDNKELQEMC